MANAFTNAGAVPRANPQNFPQAYWGDNSPVYSTAGASPQAKALNNVQKTPQIAPLTPPTPTGTISKTKTTGVDGTTHEVSYTNPDTTSQTTFPGMIKNVSDTSNNAANAGGSNYKTFSNTLGGLAGGPTQQVTTANENVTNLAKNGTPAVNAANAGLLKLQQENPYMIAAQSNPNVAADVASGRSQILGQTFGKEEAALAQNAQNALTAQGQQLSGLENVASNYGTTQGQNITAAGTGTNAGLTSQGQGITGLNTASGLVQPSPTSQGQTTYNPLTNSFSGGSYGTNLQTVVQAIKNGSMGYTTGVNSLSSLSPTAKADVLAALGSGFDTVASDANAATKGSNIQTSGTTPVNAAASVYGQGYGQLLDLQNTVSNVDQFGSLLLNNMRGLNLSGAKVVNKTIADIRSQLSSSQQAQFDTTFAQLKAQIATLLSSGGSQIPTQVTADANKIIDGTAPIKTLSDTLSRIKTEGNILTQNLQGKLNTAGGVIGAPKTGGGSSNPFNI